jgi:hypothetical protein|tara:strand:+ start:2892 stop:3422 length:531 start_codon:yes stop_codon:yes gene_type:complete
MAGSYRQVVKAKSVSVRYNEPPKSYMSWKNDICLDVVIEKQSKDGESYDYTFIISGNFKKDNPKNQWGSAFKVAKFFEAVGVNTKNISSDMLIPDAWFDQAVGKEFSYITYPSDKVKDDGKPFWNDFDIVMAAAGGQDAHKAEFDKQVTDGWIKVFQEPVEESSADDSDVDDDMDL